MSICQYIGSITDILWIYEKEDASIMSGHFVGFYVTCMHDMFKYSSLGIKNFMTNTDKTGEGSFL